MHKSNAESFSCTSYYKKDYMKPAGAVKADQKARSGGQAGQPHHVSSGASRSQCGGGGGAPQSRISRGGGGGGGYCARAQRAAAAVDRKPSKRSDDDRPKGPSRGEPSEHYSRGAPKEHMPFSTIGRRPKQKSSDRRAEAKAASGGSKGQGGIRQRSKAETVVMNTFLKNQMAGEIAFFAAQLGINPDEEPELMYIAEEYYTEPLPKGWREYWTEDDQCAYYAMGDHTQWEHPMEHYYKALVYLQRSGFQKIAEEQFKHPAEQEEIEEMAKYLGVDLKEEADMGNLVKMAVAAPLPPEWTEESIGSSKYVHNNGKVSENHPLDVYFLEIIRVRRDEKERVVREGKEAIVKAQQAVLQTILSAEGNNWRILCLTPGASKKEVRSQYRALALQVHPDKNEQPGAQKAFQLVGAAFRELMSS